MSSSSSSGGAGALPPSSSPESSSDDFHFFLLVGGCTALSVMLIVALVAFLWQRHNRTLELERKKLAKLRRHEQRKAKEAARQAAEEKKLKEMQEAREKAAVEDGDVNASMMTPSKSNEDGSGGRLGVGGSHSRQVSAFDGSSPLFLNNDMDFTHTNGSRDGFGGMMGAGDSSSDVDFNSPVLHSLGGSARWSGGSEMGMSSPMVTAMGTRASAQTAMDPGNGSNGVVNVHVMNMDGGGGGMNDEDTDSSDGEDMQYNRHDHIRLDVLGSSSSFGDGSDLNSSFDNLTFDPEATRAAAEELAALTGERVEDVMDRLRAQQEEEMRQKGMTPSSSQQQRTMGTVYTYDAPSPSNTAAAAAAVSSSLDVQASPVINYEPTRTYDDCLLYYHSPLDYDPYLLSIFSPSHAADPANVPPTGPLHPSRQPYRVIDTNYSRPLPPAAWRLLHGRSPWGQTISMDVDHLPRWWRHHQGLDVSESVDEILRIKRAARKVAMKRRRRMPPASGAHKPKFRIMTNTNRGGRAFSSRQ